MYGYYCELSCIRGIGFQSTPPLEGDGVFNVPEVQSSCTTHCSIGVSKFKMLGSCAPRFKVYEPLIVQWMSVQDAG